MAGSPEFWIIAGMTAPLLLRLAPFLLLAGTDKDPYLVKEKSVEVGRTPSFLAFGPKSRDLFVACAYDTAVVRLDGKSLRVTARHRLSPVSPLALAFPKSERALVVSNYGADTLHWIDPRNGEEQAQLKLEFKPAFLAVSKDGKKAAVSCDRSQTVYFVDLASHKVLGEPVVVNGPPGGLCFDSSGSQVYVTYDGPMSGLGRIRGSSYQHLDLEVRNTSPPVFSRDGKELFVTGREAGLGLFRLQAKNLKLLETHPLPATAQQIVLTRRGRSLAVLLPSRQLLLLLNADSLEEQQRIATGEDPRALIESPDGKQLLVASRGSGTIDVFKILR